MFEHMVNPLVLGKQGAYFFNMMRRYRKVMREAIAANNFEDRRIRCEHAREGLAFLGVEYTAPATQDLYRNYPCIYVANHQSYLDAAILCAVFERRVRFLAKSGVFRVPILGEIMQAEGHLKVYRGRGAGKNNGLREQLAKALGAGDGVCFFAEGTRSTDGALQKFKLGAFYAAVQNEVPVVPIIFEGTGRCLPKHSMKLKDFPCSMKVLGAHHPDPAILDERERVETLCAHVFKAMQEALSN